MGQIDSGPDAFRLGDAAFTRQGQLVYLAKLLRRDEQGRPLFSRRSLA